ncbi:MAG: hypothetical protein M1825_001745 [Sarcosagium campestre]|nr:MAG: hypothetical protein M1825_001745 [Sarcosagium campestre]
MTGAGLNTVDLSTLNTFQQIVLFLLILIGSPIAVSAVVVLVRKRAFELKFKDIVARERTRRRVRRRSGSRSQLELPRPSSLSRSTRGDTLGQTTSPPDQEIQTGQPRQANSPLTAPDTPSPAVPEGDHIAWNDSVQDSPSPLGHTAKPNHEHAGLDPTGLEHRGRASSVYHGEDHADNISEYSNAASFRAPAIVGRNSNFHHLDPHEREKLGGVEYRALKILSVVVPLYLFLWQFLGLIGVGAYTATYKASVTETNGLRPCYPIFLRLIIWSLRHTLPRLQWFQGYDDTLDFLLKHPRRCYTNLFPSTHTWWLLLSVIVLNGIDWIAFEILNIGNPVVESLSPSARALDGLFQALAVRSGGFYVVPISGLRIGLQVLYVLMMYISVYPVVITMRNSNVYEERSLGIYSDDPPALLGDNGNAEKGQEARQKAQQQSSSRLQRVLTPGPTIPPQQSKAYFVSEQLRLQLAHDLWALVLAVLFITIIETSSFESQPQTYSVFNILFEVMSGYGCVGISTGLPDQTYSFCGGWHTGSKIILYFVMLRGRHRGLPVAIDKAILLPGERLTKEVSE